MMSMYGDSVDDSDDISGVLQGQRLGRRMG